MNSLRPSEKEHFEDLFGMASGFVIDSSFTDAKFHALFASLVQKNIGAEMYQSYGTSKAKRLRAFWDIESDAVVGKVLDEMLVIWKDKYFGSCSEEDKKRYAKCEGIVGRLLGRPVKKVEEEVTEKAFLGKDFGEIYLNKVPMEGSVIPILEHRLLEAGNCFNCGAPLAMILLCGSILEGLLLGVAQRQPQKFNQAENSPRDKSGKVKLFPEWSLAEFINVACTLGYLKLDVKKFSHALRYFRNYIHPYQQMASGFQPDKYTAEICLQVLKAAVASLSGERK